MILVCEEGARGLWTRMVPPDPPTDYQIEKALGEL